MSDAARSWPLPTLNNLIPPNLTHPHFEGVEARPFDPASTGYSPVNAWWLAESSLLAYGNERFAREQLASSGLAAAGFDLRVIEGPTHEAQCVVIESDRFVIAAFRGTRIDSFPDPILWLQVRLVNPADFRTDIDLRLDPARHVHSGFLRAYGEIEGALRAHLADVAARRPGAALWLTGHSLGAALATVAASGDLGVPVAGLYTFGSPRVGDAAFAQAFRAPCVRVVHNSDVVPHIPPTVPGLEYRHVGALRFITVDGRVTEDPSVFEQIESNVRGHLDVLRSTLGVFNLDAIQGATRAVLDALWSRKPSALGPAIEALELDLLPVAPIADHAPIYYALALRKALGAHGSPG